jgi:hypothetical protein
MKRITRRRRLALAALLAVVVATAGFAFADQNTVNASKVGDGEGTVSGYVASAISWNLNDTAPQYVDSVSFTLDSAATEVKARVQKRDGTTWYAWASCTGAGPYTCAFPASTVETIEVKKLEVAAAS